MRRSVLDPVVLSEEERATLERWERRPKSAQALALRCRIVLACAEGGHNNEVAERIGVSRATVGKWRNRFCHLSRELPSGRIAQFRVGLAEIEIEGFSVVTPPEASPPAN